MKRWLTTVECLLMLILWGINVSLNVYTALSFIFHGTDMTLYRVVLLSLMHIMLNCWLITTISKSTNWVTLALLFITQTTPIYLLARRAWLSFVPCCHSGERAKDRRSLKAKYYLCFDVWNLQHIHLKPSVNREENPLVTCIPPNEDLTGVDVAPKENSTAPDVAPDQHANNDPEASSSNSNVSNIVPEPNLRLTKTKFKPESNIIEVSSNNPEELFRDEPNLGKYLIRSFQDLFVDEKRLSYHIVTNSLNKILHASVSNKHIKVLKEPQLCSDTHYMINYTRGHGYEHFHVMKNTCDEQIGFIKTDLSRILWVLVWPSGAIQLYELLYSCVDGSMHVWQIRLTEIIISIATWLVTQRGVGSPWFNTFLLIPVRIAFTVCHTLLIASIAISSIPLAAFTYISAKALGVLTFMLYLSYAKKVRNVELYTDEVDKYNFQPMYEPVIQCGEGVMYIIWALYWYFSRSDVPPLLAKGIAISPIVGQICGIFWLWCFKKSLKNPLQYPNEVLDFVQKLEYVRL